MDIGGFRDMHRHRRAIQIEQQFTTEHGYETPREVGAAGALEEYRAAMDSADQAATRVSQGTGPEARENSQYVIPLGFRKRALFQMDFAEAVYISELRTGPAGHSSYRNVAYAMYEEAKAKYPDLARYFRVHDVHEPVDMLKR